MCPFKHLWFVSPTDNACKESSFICRQCLWATSGCRIIWSPSTSVFCVAFSTTSKLSPGSKLFCCSSQFLSGPKKEIGWLVICLCSICIDFIHHARLLDFLLCWPPGDRVAKEMSLHCKNLYLTVNPVSCIEKEGCWALVKFIRDLDRWNH